MLDDRIELAIDRVLYRSSNDYYYDYYERKRRCVQIGRDETEMFLFWQEYIRVMFKLGSENQT